MNAGLATTVRTIAGLVLLAGLEGALAQQAPVRGITQISGDLYRFRNNAHYSVFLVTPAGIIVTDPIDAEAAGWLKAELARRFNLPVRYVVYSHAHADHIAGGEVFDDTAVVVAHEKAKAQILAQRQTAVPEITFTERLEIDLAGKRIELSYLGPNHSDSSVVMRFPQERAVFAVDIVARNRLPYRNFPDGYIDQWIDSLKALEAMDFEILAPGHGELGTKADVAAHRQYIEALRAAVLEQIRAGRSLEQAQQAVTMDAYQGWGSYADWRALNVEGMYRYLQQAPQKN